MVNESFIEQLDQAVTAIMARADVTLPPPSGEIVQLVYIAAELRDLPRKDFRTRLKDDLMRRASMTATATRQLKPVRAGFHTITPFLALKEAPELIEFVKQAFGAEGAVQEIGSGGGLHSEFKIGDSMVMIRGGGTWHGTPKPSAFHLYVENVDLVYQRALQAGAISMYEPVEQDYGDREAGVKDLAGNHWYLATHRGERYIPEGLRSVTPFLHPHGADRMIDFLKPAFGAEEISRTQSPDGRIHHATLLIGDSMIEMGEAHGEWQSMPATLFLYVDDVDSWYERAVLAGATSISKPEDQPFGGRVGGVTDPFGNTWYLGTPIKEASAQVSKSERTSTGKRIREGFHTVTPYVSVKEALELIDFVKQAFGAEGKIMGTGSQGGIHAEFRIGNSMLMIGGAKDKPTPTALHLYVADADAVYRRAIEAGATSIEEPADEPYLGDRLAGVKDVAGNQWYIATNKAAGGPPPGLRTLTLYLHPQGAARMIGFLKQAFGAEEKFLAQSPEGIVHHAKIGIGDSIIELGDPHGAYQPMPSSILLYVDDVDAWYTRAVAGGATSIGEPADQPYGDRTAAVDDPFGNIWYIATPI